MSVLNGIYPVIPTMFNRDNSLDLDAQRKVIQFALNAGAHGVVFPGVASEYNFLSPEERGELIALVAQEVNGAVPIVGGASAPTAGEVIAAGKQALAVGINHLMVMAPSSIGDDLAGQQAFFQQATDQLKGAEIILQNAPSPVGAGLSAESVAAIAKGNSAITYIKEETLPSGPAISTIQGTEIGHLKAIFGGGGARYIIDELNRGALGVMPAVELTDLHVALYQAYTGGDHEKARELYRISLPLLVSQTIYRMRLTKYVLQQRGVADALLVRAPLPEIDEMTQKDIQQMLEDLNRSFTSDV